MTDPAGALNASYRPSAKLSAGWVWFWVGKFGVERSMPNEVSEVMPAAGVRVYVRPKLRWRWKNGIANERSIAVWLGLVVGPSTLLKLKRAKSCALAEIRWSTPTEN